MPTLSITIPSEVASRVADAFIGQYPPAEGVSVETGAEKQEHVRRVLIDHIKGIVRSYESQVAAETAIASVDAEVTPT